MVTWGQGYERVRAERQWFWGELLSHWVRIPWTRTYLDLFDLIFRRDRYKAKFLGLNDE